MRAFVIFLYVVEVITCLLLIGVVLLQRGKDSGTGLSFGGGMGEAMFGAQVGNVLTKATVILGAIFLSVTLVLSILTGKGAGSIMDQVKPTAPLQQPAQPPDGALPLGGGDVALPMDETATP
jgi:preprotein translocase subunit SecG